MSDHAARDAERRTPSGATPHLSQTAVAENTTV
jgi:hypothetical protein